MGCCTSCSRRQDVFYPLVYIPLSDLDLPPPRPPSCRRKQIFKPDSNTNIRKHISKTIPERVLYGNFNTLASYLCKPANNDIERLWAIYQWIALLDIDTLLSESNRMADIYSPVEFVKKTSQDGRSHAKLFAALTKSLSIPCVLITGVTKNINYQLGEAVNRLGMMAEWNAVYVDGDWRLVDTFWGSHSVTGRRLPDWTVVCANGDVISVEEKRSDGKIKQGLNDFFFLTDPDMFVGTHLPDDDRWQLLPATVPESQFSSRVYLRERYYQMACSVRSELAMDVVLRPEKGEQLIQFELPESRSKAFDFMYLLFKNPGSCKDMKNSSLRGTVFTEIKSHLLSYCVRFPVTGRFRFDVFGVDVKQHDSFDLIASYLIEVNEPCVNFEMLPDSPSIGWGPGVETERYGLEPITHQHSVIDSTAGHLEIRFQMTDELCCSVQLKHPDKLSCQLERHALLRVDGNQLIISVRLPDRGQYAVKLYAKTGADPGRLNNVCNYLVRHTGSAAVPSHFPVIQSRRLGKRFLNCDHFQIQNISHIQDIVKTDDAQVVFKFATHKSGISLVSHISGPNINDANLAEVLTKTEDALYTQFQVTFPGRGEYGMNVFAKTIDELKLYPVFCYLVDHQGAGVDPDAKTDPDVVYITGTQVNIVHPADDPDAVLCCFDRCFYCSEPGDKIDGSLTQTRSGVGMNFLLDVLETESYNLDIYEQCHRQAGGIVMKGVHRLLPFEYDKYDESAVAQRQKRAREMEAQRREGVFTATSVKQLPKEFNRDALRGRLKMTLVINVLAFTEEVIGTCRYYGYTDDDLVPRVERHALILRNQKELGLRIREAVTTGVVLPLERILESIEEAGIEQQMGFLLAVGRNILMKKISQKIRKMDQRTVAEVKSYSAPPRAAQEVMKASLLLMGHRTKEVEDWSNIRSLIGDTQKMKQRLKDVDIDALDYKTVKKAARLMSTLTHNEVRHTSDVVDSFYSWSQNLIKLKIASKQTNADSSDNSSLKSQTNKSSGTSE